MEENGTLENFIPLRTSDIVDALCGEEHLSEERKKRFREFATLVRATYHYDFHSILNRARDAYHPFNPDADTLKLCGPGENYRARFDAMVEQACDHGVALGLQQRRL